MTVLWATIRGQFAPLFWTMVVCNLIIPFPLLAIKKLRTITGTVIASITIVAGMWIERFLIIVPALEHKFLPYASGHYSPTWVEITLMVAGFGMMGLLYLLFSKLVPMISMWELEAGVRKAPLVRRPAVRFEPGAATAKARVADTQPFATDVSR
jgi:molybdopterin-containing oxidoreductase family membrane subunit